MTRRGAVGVAFVGCLAVALAPATAVAETVCGTVAEFNQAMAEGATYSEDVTVTFDVVGVNPADFFNTKGSLAQFRNTMCATGADAGIKVYGNSDPLNMAHPPGTLKMEYGNSCCGGVCGENWADPNASAVIFVDGSETCNVTTWVRPDSIGYTLECNVGTFDALGGNPEGNVVDAIHLLEFIVPDGGTTWELPNATATNDEVCWVVVPSDMMTIEVPVTQDVTAGPAWPDTVFPDTTDLAVEAADNQGYLKFEVPEIQGLVTQTRLFMRTRPDMSADGDGGEVHVVSDHAWSEATMTWNTRPTHEAASLGRIGPAGLDTLVSLDLGPTAVVGAGTYGFAIVSPPTDGNGTHFHSKEGAPADAAYLRISYEVHDVDGDGTPDGPDCDDADPAVGPGNDEACNGVDDDCDGETDEGCPGAGTGGSDEGAADESGSDGGTGGAGSGLSGGYFPRGEESGCACATSDRDARTTSFAAFAIALGFARQRRRSR